MNKRLTIPRFGVLLLLFVALFYISCSFQPSSSHPPVIKIKRYENGLAQTPLQGWSSWSFLRKNPTELQIETQALALATTLKQHGYNYVNLDDYWYLNPATTVDSYGRWVADTQRFPDGIAALARYVHGLGLKFGLYLTPGIPVAAVKHNTPIEGTSYHARDIAITNQYTTNFDFGDKVMYRIDYSKPGAQAYVNSWAKLLSGWGIDFLKMDAVGTLHIGQALVDSQATPDILAWSRALQQSGRPIYFLLSNTLDIHRAALWRQSANAWRIDDDVECYTCSTITSWKTLSTRFGDEPSWAQWAESGGWNDLDSLDVGNGMKDGLTNDERQTYMTLWAISAAPLYTGDDLTTLDDYGLLLLTNDEVIGVDQNGVAGTPLSTRTKQQVWRVKEPDGTIALALFNLGSSQATITIHWSELDLHGRAAVRDLWSHKNLGTYASSFSTTLNAHASRLLKIMPTNAAARASSETIDAFASTLCGWIILDGCQRRKALW